LRQIYEDKIEKRNNYDQIEMNLTEKAIDNMPINVMDKVLFSDWSIEMKDYDWCILGTRKTGRFGHPRVIYL
jgi:hypothetical protein